LSALSIKLKKPLVVIGTGPRASPNPQIKRSQILQVLEQSDEDGVEKYMKQKHLSAS